MIKYCPEGELYKTEENMAKLCAEGLETAIKTGDILEAMAVKCGTDRALYIKAGSFTAVIPREEASIEGRDVAILSKVGKPVCFRVIGKDGPRFRLSRKRAAEEALSHFMETLVPGDVIKCRVSHIEPFGVFVDIGCGVISFIGIENISVSRIGDPSERFTRGQDIFAVVSAIDREKRRICLSHKELLGTWEENAARFSPGETVGGIVRHVESYGVFIELAPNLSGLAEWTPELEPGMPVSVYIRSINPEKMKIKLSVIDTVEKSVETLIKPSDYFISEGHISRWLYTPPGYPRVSESYFIG